MHERKLPQIIGLHEREGRAWHFERRVARQVANDRTGERCLARAEVARQGHKIAGLRRVGDVDGEPLGGVLVRQGYRKARSP